MVFKDHHLTERSFKASRLIGCRHGPPDLLLPSGRGFRNVNTFRVSVAERRVVEAITVLEELRQEVAPPGRRPAGSSGQEVVPQFHGRRIRRRTSAAEEPKPSFTFNIYLQLTESSSSLQPLGGLFNELH